MAFTSVHLIFHIYYHKNTKVTSHIKKPYSIPVISQGYWVDFSTEKLMVLKECLIFSIGFTFHNRCTVQKAGEWDVSMILHMGGPLDGSDETNNAWE